MKRKFGLLVVFLFIFNIVLPSTSKAEGRTLLQSKVSNSQEINISSETSQGDSIPPVLNSIKMISAKTLNVGNKVEIEANISDDNSGVLSASLVYDSPSKNTSSYIGLKYDDVSKLWKGSYTIKSIDEVGEWTLRAIYIEDNAGINSNIYEDNLPQQSNINYIISNSNIDLIPPKLHSVNIDKQVAGPEEEIFITIKATDDLSEVRFVDVTYQLPSGSKREYNLLLDSNGNYSGKIRIYKYDESGVWKISSIGLSDRANNYIIIANSELNPKAENIKDLSSCNFKVEGTAVDITPPELKGIRIDNQVVKPGEEVSITVEAEDIAAGIDYIQIAYQSPSGLKSKREIGMIPNSDGKYIIKIPIGEYDEAGIWRISSISLYDMAGNFVFIGNSELDSEMENSKDLSVYNFKVEETVLDTVPPELKSINIDKQVVKTGEQVIITAEVEDNLSGVESINIEYLLPSGNETRSFSMYLNSEGIYCRKILIDKYSQLGIWRVLAIHLSDKAGNHIAIANSELDNQVNNSRDLSIYSFKVEEVLPTNEIMIDKANATIAVGNTLKLNATLAQGDLQGDKLIWSTNDAKIATVDENGLVTGVKEGAAIITVTTPDGKYSANCEVTVTIDECFIATAAYGSKFQPSVVMLRSFRDEFLLTNKLGSVFVNFYYKNSPPIARVIVDNDFLKITTRVLLAPIISVVYLIYHPTLIIIILAICSIPILLKLKKRYRLKE